MLTNVTTKIDRFYIIFGVVLLILAIVVITTLRNIFGAFNKAGEVDPASLQSSGIHINEAKLNQALEELKNKKSVVLDLP